ncbi:4-oxalocrotonate tautomerase [Agrobacterium tumefaciens]|uniref:tautomerase family protein n=1 Tax=Agrobacterium tumefaciens TaxID=358 RepID=UPI001571A6C1|nr:tautomerase family protein [Agrobacterium tumefaciens]NTE68168.1 4-oxalocrotonate tautomerase [Agrobacterium tumefaciens]
MPEICVFAAEGRSADQKRGLCRDITEAVVNNFGVDRDAVIVQIIEIPRNSKSKGGVMYSETNESVVSTDLSIVKPQ